MKKLITSIGLLFVCASALQAQDKYFTKTGKITFDATVPASPEKISGTNKTVTAVLVTSTGQVQFAVLMKGFLFERALMEEHFNENYVESSKFPKSEFKGMIANNASINYGKDGSYPATVKGKMTIHGETKDVETAGTVKIAGGKITLAANFAVPLEAYKISVPTLVADKVASNASIIVDCALEPLK